MTKILKLMANMLAIATFALIIASCEEKENTDPGEVEISSIKVEPNFLYMEIDSTVILTATLSPDNALTDALTWSTYNKDIATVSVTGARTAVIRGVSIGTTVITVVTPNNKRAICEVTVSKSVPLVAISIVPSDSLHLEPREMKTIVATQGPANATNYHPVWTTSNPEVVTVENGTVRGVAPGRATVTVTSGNISKSLNVLVTNPLSDITIEPGGDLHLTEIGNKQQLTATTTPEFTKDYNPIWRSGNENVATVSQTGLVTAVGLGTTIVSITSDTISRYINVRVTSAVLTDSRITNPADIFISAGQNLQINALPIPESAENYILNWASSNESVATVSQEGLVRGISAGMATVTVSSGLLQKSVTVFVEYTLLSPSTEEWTAESRGGNHDWVGDGGSVPGAGQPRFVLDGDKTTGWHSNVSNPLPQCMVVNMKTSHEVGRIVIWHVEKGLESKWLYYETIKVYLSNSPVEATEYQDSWGEPVGVHEYTGGYDPVTIDLNPNSQGQYLIIYFPNSSNAPYISFGELDVYGK
jgi:uncharacterized protein YjdB